MEFLQRHLPRLYQAVQSALDYITNVTAQIFGAPPNAPQPRNAQAKAPLRSEDAAAPEETRPSLGADHMTLAADVLLEDAALEATEENMKMYGIQQDVEIQAQETAVRHRKENIDRTVLELHHTTSEGKDILSHHHQVSIEEHKDHRSKVTTDDLKSTKLEEIDKIPCSVIREVLHAEDHTIIDEEVQKVSQEAVLCEGHTEIKNEEKSSTSRLDNVLKDLEPKRYQEHKVPPTRNKVPGSDLNSEIEENSCSTSNTIVSSNLERTIIIQGVSKGASVCHMTVTSQEVDQESTEDVPAPPVIAEYDDLDIPDIKRQHKKLVTPVSAADRSPCDQGEEARNTWEHLQETAVRLAMHCNLLQDDDQELETLRSGEIIKTCIVHEMHSSGPDEQGDNQELLEMTSHDPKEVKELSSEEKERLDEVGGFSKSEENDQGGQDQKAEKMRRRVHFSPSTEERDQMFSLTSDDTVCIKIDLLQEGALEPTTEHTGHPANPYPRPEPNDKEHDLLCSNQDTEPFMMDPTPLEDQVNPQHVGHTVWYDELEVSTDKDMFESIGDTTYHNVTLGLGPEESLIAIPENKSPTELSKDVPSFEEMQDSEQEPTKNPMSMLHDMTTHSGVDCEVEYHHGEGPWSFDKVAGPFEKSPGVVLEDSSQEGLYFAEHEVTSISLDVLGQSSEEIREDLLLSEDIESLEEPVHGKGVSEDTTSKEELLDLWHHPSVEGTEDTAKGELTSMTDELSIHRSVRLQGDHHRPSENKALAYTPGEGYNQISVQECDTFKKEQLQDDLISIESERCPSTDPSNTDKVQTAEDPAKAEDSEDSVGRNLPMRNETQKEDLARKESEDVEVVKEVKHISKQIEEHVSIKDEELIQEIEDYTWYKQDSYQSDGLVIYGDSNEEPGSQKDQTPSDHTEESSEQLLYKDYESGVMSKDGEARQTNPQASGSDEDSTKVSHLYIASEAEPTNTSLSAYPEDAFGSDHSLEDFSTHPETGFDLLSEIQSVINKTLSQQDVSEVMGRSEATYSAVSGRNTEMESTEPLESGFQTGKVVQSVDIQCMHMPGHPVDKISEDLTQENQVSVTPDEASGDQSLDRVKELEISLNTGSLAVDQVEVILDHNFGEDSICKPHDESDLLSEFHSVMSMDLPAEVLEIVSTVKVGKLDKGMEDIAHFNEETNAGILKKTTVEECSPGLHLSEELGLLIEPKQTFVEEHCSSIGIAVTETEIEVSDIGLVISNTSVQTSEDGREGDYQSPVTLHETSSVHLGDQPPDHIKELEIPLETGSPAEGNIEVLVGSILGLYSGAVEGGGDILSNADPSAEVIVSTMNVDEPDGGHSNDEAIVGILSEAVIVEDHEEDCPNMCLSEELESIIELEHTFEEQRYSSIVVTETQVEAADINKGFRMTETDPSPDTHHSLIPNHTLEQISESKNEEESQSSKTLDDAFGTQFGDLKVDKPVIPSETESLVEDIDVVLSFVSELQGEGDLLTDIKSVKMKGHPTEVGRAVSAGEEDILDTSKVRHIPHESAVQADILPDTVPDEQEKIHNNVSVICHPEELGSSLQPSQKREENQHNSSSRVSCEESCIGLDIVSPSEGNVHGLLEDQDHKKMDPLLETEEGISDTSKVCDIMDESAFRVALLPDTSLSDDQEKIKNKILAISSEEELGSSLEPSQKLEEYEHGPSSPAASEESRTGLDIVSTSEENGLVLLEDQKHKEIDLLSEVQSAITLEYLAEATTSMSTVKAVASNEAAGSEKEGSEETTQEFACSKPSEVPEKKLHEQDLSSAVLTIDTHRTEDITGCEINESSKTTDYFSPSGLETQLLPSIDHTKQTAMEGGGKEQISNEEAVCLGQNKHATTILTEEPPKLTEPPTRMGTSEDQERSVVDHKGTLMEPSVEEEDDIDDNLLPHNPLDISAQKSRVQLRRKTSIRRKQGQRQATSDGELVEPPQPVARPRPMGVAMFPGNMPIFPVAPVLTSSVSHPAEEQKEVKPAEEELLIKPKKGIPKHAGFGIPHPQMMQELQARLKKKKPNE